LSVNSPELFFGLFRVRVRIRVRVRDKLPLQPSQAAAFTGASRVPGLKNLVFTEKRVLGF